MVGVAQLVRALDCGSRGRRFETGHPPQLTTGYALFRFRPKSLAENYTTQTRRALSDDDPLCWARHRVRAKDKFKGKISYIGMSPSGKAPDFDSGIRRFEPFHPSHAARQGGRYDPLAQSVEHLTFNQGVRSSSLRRVTRNRLLPCGTGGLFLSEKTCQADLLPLYYWNSVKGAFQYRK